MERFIELTVVIPAILAGTQSNLEVLLFEPGKFLFALSVFYVWHIITVENLIFGVGQISFQKLSEQKVHNYIIEQYKNKSDSKRKKVFEVLARNPVTMSEPLPLAYTRVRDYAMHDLGIGTMHNMKNVETGIFMPSLLFKE